MILTPRPAKPLNLGFLTPYNPYDSLSFSGTSFFAARALDSLENVNLRVLGPHKKPTLFDRLLRRAPEPIEVSSLDLGGLDAVLGLVATPLLDQMNARFPHIPFLHVTDATPSFLREVYGWAVPRTADEEETRVASRARVTVYSSNTMASRAAIDLDIPSLRPAVVPFGVNLDDLPDTCPAKPPIDKLRLLFVGVDWVRKGGDVALAVLDELNSLGRQTELSVVGRCPVRHQGHHGLKAIGFLNKGRASDRKKLSSLFRDAHLLILPSRGDCTPMVVAEAMVHGTPVIATDTGGIKDQIGGMGAGRTMPMMASLSEWTTAIQELTNEPDGYAQACDAAFDRGCNVFSWKAWASDIEGLTRSALAEGEKTQRRIA